MTQRVTAQVHRDGRWWFVTVPEVAGVFTQARRLDEVADQTADAVATLLDVPVDSVEVTVDLVLEDGVASSLGRAAELREQSAHANAEAAAEQRRGVAALVELGLTLRDIAWVLGVSVQRAHQLVDEARRKAADKSARRAKRMAEIQATDGGIVGHGGQVADLVKASRPGR